MAYDYVRKMYGVEPTVGQRVQLNEGRQKPFGTIARERSPNHYVHVVFDGQKHASPCHPTSLDYSPTPHRGEG